ncbi:hypothetical protein LAZ67_4004410 [Cordylochernes scorpioides]|uniref:Mariner Mos1 transposase n=1 Tax=Cordylochernes scorpioides TaxID=51811 RepID=A0ABY6KEE9_9ARAC|nr:hypothetical protein LAZ67_4004410 [Cordylochernes scorpioides]
MRRLREAVRLERSERWQNNDWILHVDNARPHTAHVVLQFLAKHSTIQIPHPPYSPDLAPNDFFLYSKLKMKLKGRKFDNYLLHAAHKVGERGPPEGRQSPEEETQGQVELGEAPGGESLAGPPPVHRQTDIASRAGHHQPVPGLQFHGLPGPAGALLPRTRYVPRHAHSTAQVVGELHEAAGQRELHEVPPGRPVPAEEQKSVGPRGAEHQRQLQQTQGGPLQRRELQEGAAVERRHYELLHWNPTSTAQISVDPPIVPCGVQQPRCKEAHPPVSQKAPVAWGGQAQKERSLWLTHMPPFRQEILAQPSGGHSSVTPRHVIHPQPRGSVDVYQRTYAQPRENLPLGEVVDTAVDLEVAHAAGESLGCDAEVGTGGSQAEVGAQSDLVQYHLDTVDSQFTKFRKVPKGAVFNSRECKASISRGVYYVYLVFQL